MFNKDRFELYTIVLLLTNSPIVVHNSIWIQSVKMSSSRDPEKIGTDGSVVHKKDERNGSDGTVGNEKLMVVL